MKKKSSNLKYIKRKKKLKYYQLKKGEEKKKERENLAGETGPTME